MRCRRWLDSLPWKWTGFPGVDMMILLKEPEAGPLGVQAVKDGYMDVMFA